LYTDDLKYEIGKSICLRDGNDVAILATGILVNDALQVSEELGKERIQARVIDMHTIKPLDEEAVLSSAKETGSIVTVEDANIVGGLGGAVAELLSEKYPVPIRRVGVKDQFGESGTSEEIKECYGLTPPFIKKAVHEVMSAKRSQNLHR
jgi:transketolase